MKKIFIVVSILVPLTILSVTYFLLHKPSSERKNGNTFFPTKPSPTTIPTPTPLPIAKTLPNDYQVFESFNNCGPASLSMALSYFGIQKSQEELGQSLRPYQNPQGDNDDKDVTMAELEREAQKYGLLAYYRPNGDLTKLKKFIANGMPVITETLLTMNDDIGHFRVMKGYDDTTQMLLQDDSYQGHNISYSYADFNYMWQKFNYKYVVLVPKDKQQLAEEIIGKDLDKKVAWQQTAKLNQSLLTSNPNDVTSRFNLSIAHYYLGEYQASVSEFEKVESLLSFRTLWYQTEPIKAYFELGQYDRVFSLTNTILNTGNRAFSELYIIQGDIYKKQGNTVAARQAYEQAVFYNVNLPEAKTALQSTP